MDRNPHILIVDDDAGIRTLLSKYLTQNSFRVSTAADGASLFRMLETSRVDLIVLDLMLPGESGLTLCRKLRDLAGSPPVVMLTAMGEEADRIIGLELGADDYLPKPFSPRELLARIKAVMRRAGGQSDGIASNLFLSFEGWRLDITRRELRSPEGLLVALTSGEFELLVAFLEHPQRVLTRDQLLDLARGRTAIPFDRSVDVQVSRLRRKIEHDPKDPMIIRTVRSGGYLFAATVEGMTERASSPGEDAAPNAASASAG